MASSTAKISLRLAVAVLLLLAAFYVGRPLYWKLSATIHEIHQKRQTVKQGISQFMQEARKTVGWVNDESDSGVIGDRSRDKTGVATARRILLRNS